MRSVGPTRDSGRFPFFLGRHCGDSQVPCSTTPLQYTLLLGSLLSQEEVIRVVRLERTCCPFTLPFLPYLKTFLFKWYPSRSRVSSLFSSTLLLILLFRRSRSLLDVFKTPLSFGFVLWSLLFSLVSSRPSRCVLYPSPLRLVESSSLVPLVSVMSF